MPFNSRILSTDHLILTSLSMTESMGMRTMEPGKGELTPGTQITSPANLTLYTIWLYNAGADTGFQKEWGNCQLEKCGIIADAHKTFFPSS